MKNKELLVLAQRAAVDSGNWIELSNSLFHPLTGLLARAFPKMKDRRVFFKTQEYKAMRKLVVEAMERDGFDYDPTRPRRRTNKAPKEREELCHV